MRSVGSGSSVTSSVRSTVRLHALELGSRRGAMSALREAQVLRDGEVRQQRRILEDGGEADLAGALAASRS